LRTCHLDVCSGGAEQFQECRRRSADHEGGHALLACLVAASGGRRTVAALTRCVFGWGAPLLGEFTLSEERVPDPWNDALVLLGGPASDAHLHGQQISAEDPDCSRAQRLLKSAGLGLGLTDALALARELVAHHHGVMQKMADAIAIRVALVGSEAWELFRQQCRDPASALKRAP